MSKISGKDTKPEVKIRKFLFSQGLRFRKNVKELPGKPDIVLPKYKVVIFVNGCFWHGHDRCNKSAMPKSNTNFWFEKISKNKERDKRNYRALKKLGWSVVIVWQCKLRSSIRSQKTLSNLVENILRRPRG